MLCALPARPAHSARPETGFLAGCEAPREGPRTEAVAFLAEMWFLLITLFVASGEAGCGVKMKLKIKTVFTKQHNHLYKKPPLQRKPSWCHCSPEPVAAKGTHLSKSRGNRLPSSLPGALAAPRAPSGVGLQAPPAPTLGHCPSQPVCMAVSEGNCKPADDQTRKVLSLSTDNDTRATVSSGKGSSQQKPAPKQEPWTDSP